MVTSLSKGTDVTRRISYSHFGDGFTFHECHTAGVFYISNDDVFLSWF